MAFEFFPENLQGFLYLILNGFDRHLPLFCNLGIGETVHSVEVENMFDVGRKVAVCFVDEILEL